MTLFTLQSTMYILSSYFCNAGTEVPSACNTRLSPGSQRLNERETLFLVCPLASLTNPGVDLPFCIMCVGPVRAQSTAARNGVRRLTRASWRHYSLSPNPFDFQYEMRFDHCQVAQIGPGLLDEDSSTMQRYLKRALCISRLYIRKDR